MLEELHENLFLDVMDLRVNMLSIILLIKGAEGLQSTMSSKREPQLMEINVNEGENITLFIEEKLAFGEIKTLEWVYRKTNISTGNDSILCQMETFGNFEVNKLYQAKVEKCNETHILLTNVTLKDEGYYLRKELRENTGNMESQLIFLKVLETRIRDENESSTTVPDKSDKNLWALLTLGILIFVPVIYIVYKKRAKSDLDKGPHHEKGSDKKLLDEKKNPAAEAKSALGLTPDVNGELKSTSAIGGRADHVTTSDVIEGKIIGLNDSQSLDPQHEKENEKERHYSNNPEMMKELEELRCANLCKVCKIEKRNIHLMPCCHVVTCAKCSSSLELCPLPNCNKKITEKLEIHFA